MQPIQQYYYKKHMIYAFQAAKRSKQHAIINDVLRIWLQAISSFQFDRISDTKLLFSYDETDIIR